MEFSASQIAAIVNGEIIGSSSVIVTDLAKIEEGQEGTLSFLSNPKYEEFIYTTKSSICIVNKDFIPVKPLPLSLTLIKVENSYTCFAQLLELYDNLNKKEAKAIVSAIAKGADQASLATKRKNAAVIVIANRNLSTEKSFRNFGNIEVIMAKDVNPVELLTYKYVVVADAQESIDILEKRLTATPAKSK